MSVLPGVVPAHPLASERPLLPGESRLPGLKLDTRVRPHLATRMSRSERINNHLQRTPNFPHDPLLAVTLTPNFRRSSHRSAPIQETQFDAAQALIQ